MEISEGLTAAWLDAVRRAQSDTARRFTAQAPDTAPAFHERTLSDVIERAVKSGGAVPPPESRPVTETSATTSDGHVLDVRV